MRLIVHMGFHKTASTHLQHLFNDNHAALAERGVFYAHQEGYPAHHSVAWALLLGDATLFAAMLVQAKAADARDVILSSEDLEGVVFNPQVAGLIERTARAQGVTDIEWHIAIREPGAAFASLFAQLQHHVYADIFGLFAEAMRKGVVFIADPMAGGAGTPYWFYCFDHARHIAEFADVGRRAFVHDYADGDPYPGWRLVARLGAMDAITAMPGAAARNARLDDAAVAAGYRARIADAAGDADAALLMLADASIAASIAGVSVCADRVGRRYAPSYAAAIRHWGRW